MFKKSEKADSLIAPIFRAALWVVPRPLHGGATCSLRSPVPRGPAQLFHHLPWLLFVSRFPQSPILSPPPHAAPSHPRGGTSLPPPILHDTLLGPNVFTEAVTVFLIWLPWNGNCRFTRLGDVYDSRKSVVQGRHHDPIQELALWGQTDQEIK